MLNKYVIGASILSTLTCVSFAMYMNFVGQNVLLGTVLTFAVFAIVYSGLYSQFKTAVDSVKSSLAGVGDGSGTNGSVKEGLTMMAPGSFPSSESELLLADWYPENKPFHPSGLTYDTMWKDYPTFPANSMKTNLIKYWDNPSNGTCMYPSQCDAFYKKIVPQKIEQPVPPQWGSGIRVNFYDTCLFGQSEDQSSQ